MTGASPYEAHPEFYGNPVIQMLAHEPRWTVTEPGTKMPINIREVLSSGRIWGAHEISAECLMPLDEMLSQLPDVANNAFYLRASIDRVLVLDIEKTCPPTVARELLKMPALLRERSLSGLGWHMVMPLPDNFADFPIAARKRVLKQEDGWYEVLVDHWVTFTRDTTPEPPVDPDAPSWERVYASLAEKAVETPRVALDIDDERPDIPRFERIVSFLSEAADGMTADAYGGDASRFEFAVIGRLYNRLTGALPVLQDAEPDADYSDQSVQAWLVYSAAKSVIPHREKHDELRAGVPLLMSSTVSLISQRVAKDRAKERADAAGSEKGASS